MNKYEVKEIEKKENGILYKLSVVISDKEGFIDDVYFVTEKSNDTKYYKLNFIKHENGQVYFENEIFLDTCSLYRFYFKYLANQNLKYLKNEKVNDNGIIKEEMGKLSVNFNTPSWAKGKIMYHIFVDRFNKAKNKLNSKVGRRIHKSWDEEMIIGPDKDGVWNNDFYGGSLNGITEKLDYIKSLGVTILYLSPIVESQSNHRYDAADFEKVDPYLGCNEDLKILCDKAHNMGMKVILDAVFNHTGNDSKYFNEYGRFNSIGAFQSSNSPYYSFFKKNNYCGKDYFDYWWGMTNLPVCNGYDENWQNYILGVGGIIDQWYKLGIDGLRLDVADELTDEFIEGIRKACKRNKEDSFILGEVWKNPMRMNRNYLESGKGMDSVMNYSFIDALLRYFKYGDVNKLAYIIKDIKSEYPEDTINTLMNFTSTHDISRAIDLFSSNEFNEYSEWAWNPKCEDHNFCKNYKLSKEEYEKGKEKYMAYVYTLALMPGILSIFYGDEVGVEGLGNLANRKTFPWGKEDKDLLDFFKFIGDLRNNEKELEEANLKIIEINNQHILFERKKDDEKIFVAVNRTGEISKYNVPNEYKNLGESYSLKKSKPGLLNPYGAITIKSKKFR